MGTSVLSPRKVATFRVLHGQDFIAGYAAKFSGERWPEWRYVLITSDGKECVVMRDGSLSWGTVESWTDASETINRWLRQYFNKVLTGSNNERELKIK